jgi:hypothetical protein
MAQLRPRLDLKTMEFGRPQSVQRAKSDVAITTASGDPELKPMQMPMTLMMMSGG